MNKKIETKITNLNRPLLLHTVDHAPHHGQHSSHEKPVIDQALKNNFERILSRFPADRKKSAIIPILLLTQVYNGGSLDETIVAEVAEYLNIEIAEAHEVATFYSMFNLSPTGKYQFCVCQSISCQLCGQAEIKKTLEKTLGIQLGETTDDGLFSIKSVECLGACGGAPVLMLGDQYHENCSPKSVVELIEHLKNSSMRADSFSSSK